METNTGIITNIGIEHLHAHPDNPRKDVGDVSELAASMQQNGVMQNLTVIPQDEDLTEFTVLIGHRRLAAAKQAGMHELPCKIVEGLSHAQQVQIMICENMQRADLTVREQAESFQMLLDLGQTEDQIAHDTGFSRSTIRHRLEIAKIPAEKIKKLEHDNNFQLTITDYVELERLKNTKQRMEVLQYARSSFDLRTRVEREVADEHREIVRAAAIKEAAKWGAKDSKKHAYEISYSDDYKTIAKVDLNKEGAALSIPEKYRNRDDLEYASDYNEFRVFFRDPRVKKDYVEEKTKEKEFRKREKELKDIFKSEQHFRDVTLARIVSGNAIKNVTDDNEKLTVVRIIWPTLAGAWIESQYSTIMSRLLYDEDYFSLSKEDQGKVNDEWNSQPVEVKMLVAAEQAVESNGYFDSESYSQKIKYSSSKMGHLDAVYEALEHWGFITQDSAEQLMNSKCRYYDHEETEADEDSEESEA